MNAAVPPSTKTALRVASKRVSARPARIALFGLFGRGNLGNDASLEAMLNFLRRDRPEAEIFCVCKEPDVVERTFGVPTVPIRWTGLIPALPRRPERLFQKIPARIVDLAHAARHLHGADAMIVPGTGILDDYGERPGGMPFDILKWCVAARMTGTRVAFVSIGAGPIRNARSRLMMVTAARLAQYRSYRDQVSRNFMAEAGIDAGRAELYPDLVFGLDAPCMTPDRLAVTEGAARLTVGVGIMSYRGWFGFAPEGEAVFERYMEKMVGFVGHLLQSGRRVRLLTGDSDDWPAVEIALDRIPTAYRSMVVAEPIASLHDLTDQIASTDVVVATRFHNIVCALKLGRPTISIAYAEKNDAIMSEMGLGELCHQIDRIELADLIEQFEHVAADRDRFSRNLCGLAKGLRQALAAQEKRLLCEVLA